MTAQNLIEILEACAHNTNIPLDKLEVKISDSGGWIHTIESYNTMIPFDETDIFVLLEA